MNDSGNVTLYVEVACESDPTGAERRTSVVVARTHETPARPGQGEHT